MNIDSTEFSGSRVHNVTKNRMDWRKAHAPLSVQVRHGLRAEAVALVPHEGTQSSGAGHLEASSHPDSDQQQELLASVETTGDANGNDERVAQNAGPGEYSCAVEEGARIR